MANYYATVSGAGNKDGSDWANAFGNAELTTHQNATAVAGDVYYVAGGTYTHSGIRDTRRDGSGTAKISMIGVNSGTTAEPPTVSDFATGVNRPLFSGNDYLLFGDYWDFKNLRFTTSAGGHFRPEYYTTIFNCYVGRTAGSGTALEVYGPNFIILDSEFSCPGGTAINAASRSIIMQNCYIHGSSIGLSVESFTSVINNIFDTCTTGIAMSTKYQVHIWGNTFYNNNNCLSGTTTNANVIGNNTFSDSTNGINFSSTSPQTLIDYNNYYNNTTDVTGVSKGANALAVNPNFTDAANGDFSLTSSSDLIGAGFGIRLGVG